MNRTCIVFSNKRTSSGKTLSIRGIAKKRGGIGLKRSGQDKRVFKCNIKKKSIYTIDGGKKKVKISSKGLKTLYKWQIFLSRKIINYKKKILKTELENNKHKNSSLILKKNKKFFTFSKKHLQLKMKELL